MNENNKVPAHYWLYVLECEDNKYYVGVTSKTPKQRMDEHIRGVRSAKWTLKYKPLKLIDQKDLGIITYAEAERYEDKVIRAYIKKVGINNARGGDLRDAEDYIVRFGRIFLATDWEVITIVIFFMLALCVSTVTYYLKS